MSNIHAFTATSRGVPAESGADNANSVPLDAAEKASAAANSAARAASRISDLEEQVDELEDRIDDLENESEGPLIQRAADEIRYGNLDEALIYLARAIPALNGLPPLVARELARRECGRADA